MKAFSPWGAKIADFPPMTTAKAFLPPRSACIKNHKRWSEVRGRKTFALFSPTKPLFFSLHVLFTSPLSTTFSFLSLPPCSTERIDSLLFSIPFARNKKFFDSEKSLESKLKCIKRFPLWLDAGGKGEWWSQHCYVFIFSTWFFRYKTREKNENSAKRSEKKKWKRKSLNEITESSKGKLIFI